MGFDPLTWLLARLGSSLGPVLAVAVILLLLFWGRLLGLLRRLWSGSLKAARRSAASGPLCADCAAPLTGSADRLDCPQCRGAWLTVSGLARLLAAKRRPAIEWTPVPGPAVEAPCPLCTKAMSAGRLLGEDFVVYRCGPCSGLWFGRTERISLELRVLG